MLRPAPLEMSIAMSSPVYVWPPPLPVAFTRLKFDTVKIFVPATVIEQDVGEAIVPHGAPKLAPALGPESTDNASRFS